MSENGDAISVYEDENDDLAHQVCYVFKPTVEEDEQQDVGPRKKRKLNGRTVEVPNRFPRLLGGQESPASARLRHATFSKTWQNHQRRIDIVSNHVDGGTVSEVTGVLKSHMQDRPHGVGQKIPVGLLISYGGIEGTRVLDLWKHMPSVKSNVLVSLRSSHCPNLQATLKNIIKKSIQEIKGIEAYHDHVSAHKKLIPMVFDLELLQIFVEENGVSQVAISIPDIENFSMHLLCELILTFSSWSDRIRFVLFLGLNTTVELFEARLPKSILRLLEPTVINIKSEHDLHEEIFGAVQCDNTPPLFLGPAPVSALKEISVIQETTARRFARMMEYMYMSHFFANPLAALLADSDVDDHENDTALAGIIRLTDSFQSFCENLLASKKEEETSRVRNMLEDDKLLMKEARAAVRTGQKVMRNTVEVIRGMANLYAGIRITNTESIFCMVAEAYQNLQDLTSSRLYLDTTDRIQNLSSAELLVLLESFDHTPPATMTSLGLDIFTAKLARFHEDVRFLDVQCPARLLQIGDQGETPASPTPKKPRGRKPTSKAKPTSAKGKAGKAEEEYATFLPDFLAYLQNVVSNASISPQDELPDSSSTATSSTTQIPLFMSEAFVFNLRQPYQMSLMNVRPRHAIERALSRPRDYLDHHFTDIDAVKQRVDPAPQAPVSVLYTSLQEAGTVVNVKDLFDAFTSRFHFSRAPPEIVNGQCPNEEHRLNGAKPGSKRSKDKEGHETQSTLTQDEGDEMDVGEEEDEDLEQEEQEGGSGDDELPDKEKVGKINSKLRMALFYRALSELRLLGLIKSSSSTQIKKRVAGRGGAGGEIDFIAKTSWAGM